MNMLYVSFSCAPLRNTILDVISYSCCMSVSSFLLCFCIFLFMVVNTFGLLWMLRSLWAVLAVYKGIGACIMKMHLSFSANRDVDAR